MCNYCQAKGHWKNECPVLKVNVHHSAGNKKTKSAIFGAKSVGLVTSVRSKPELAAEKDCESLSSSFTPFVTEGYVSLVGTKERKRVRIL